MTRAHTSIRELGDLRVCVLAPPLPSWDPRVAWRESASLARVVDRVALIAQHNPTVSPPPGVHVIAMPTPVITRWDRIRAMPTVYRLARGGVYDVYHATGPDSLVLGILLKWRTGTKLVFDSHEAYHMTAARFLTGWKARLVTAGFGRVMGFLARQADHVIVVSFSSEAFYRDKCRCKNVTIIHNSPHPDDISPTSRRESVNDVLVHNSYLGEDRGRDELLQALALMNEVRPVYLHNVGRIAHKGDEEAFWLKVDELGLREMIRVTGWIDYSTMGAELNRGAIGLITVQPTPNNTTTLHNKTFNYMAAGLALIGPRDTDTEQLLKMTNSGVSVDTTDPEALAKTALALLNNPAEVARLGASGRRAIEETFGWHLMEKELGRIYAGLFGLTLVE